MVACFTDHEQLPNSDGQSGNNEAGDIETVRNVSSDAFNYVDTEARQRWLVNELTALSPLQIMCSLEVLESMCLVNYKIIAKKS